MNRQAEDAGQKEYFQRDAIQQYADQREEQIGNRTGERRKRHSFFGVPEIAGIDWDGIRPAEAEEDEAERAPQVKMLQRIHRDPAAGAGGRIAHFFRREPVCALMYRDGDQNAGEAEKKGDDAA